MFQLGLLLEKGEVYRLTCAVRLTSTFAQHKQSYPRHSTRCANCCWMVVAWRRTFRMPQAGAWRQRINITHQNSFY